MLLELTIIGNLGNDAVIKEFNGKKFISFSVAHTEKYKNRDNEDVEKTTWISCLKSVKEGSKLVDFLKKGTQVYVKGGISASVYQNKNGESIAAINCNVRDLQLLGTKKDNNVSQPQPKQQVEEHIHNAAVVDEDDLPF